jgi:hypothetical protein
MDIDPTTLRMTINFPFLIANVIWFFNIKNKQKMPVMNDRKNVCSTVGMRFWGKYLIKACMKVKQNVLMSMNLTPSVILNFLILVVLINSCVFELDIIDPRIDEFYEFHES